MKITTVLCATLAIVGSMAAILVPLTLYRAGSPALPAWRAAVIPGPVSAAHAFLATQCESCHTPNQGISAETCITCHAFAPELLAKQDTAFHATVAECASCHVEHKAGDRPIRMDHRALIVAGATRAPDLAERSALAALERLLDEAGTALGPPSAALLAKQAERLDCATCHSAQDPHRGRAGVTCQSCHTTANWAVAGWQHPSPRSTDCAQCHEAPASHGGEHFLGLAQRVSNRRPDRIEQCYLCHQTNSFHSFHAAGSAEHR